MNFKEIRINQWGSIFGAVKSFLLLSTVYIHLNAQSLITPFESNNNTTATYEECIGFYKSLEKSSGLVKITEAGSSDTRYPIHTVVISDNKEFTADKVRKSGKAVLLINNGIHPGEPDGVDASMLFAKEMVMNPGMSEILKNLTIVIIPVYNIGGSLNRNDYLRVNQNGPMEYGFRGNAQYLDLNRDFIKCDSRNTETFYKIFQTWDPDVFLDTHCSDGADYPYVMTLIVSQRQKLQKHLGDYVFTELVPALYQRMKNEGLEALPYVNAEGDPANGIYDFMDLPRLSSGYAALFHSIPFVSESHMLKPYNARVNAQKILMRNLAWLCYENKKQILDIRKLAKENFRLQKDIALQWKIQEDTRDSLRFKGYTTEKSTSEVTGKERLRYNKNKPYEKNIAYYNYATVELKVEKPDAYILPAAFNDVADRLKWNGVQMHELPSDSIIEAVFYRIVDYKSPAKPYENHFLHHQVKAQTERLKRKYFKGDYIIFTDQPAIRFIVETLEPQAPDSYFAWNFFDAILQRKEYFSDYLFEDLALEILQNNPMIKSEFEKKKNEDSAFAGDAHAMLSFIYARSKYSEPGYMLYPVGRWIND